MATQLKSIVRFVNVAAGATVTAPHVLNINGIDVIPDVVEMNVASFLGIIVTADATGVTLTNTTGSTISVDVLCEHWHTIERAFGSAAVKDLAPQPFIVGGGAAIVAPAFTGIRKNILNNTLTPLLSVDLSLTTTPPGIIPDYTWGGTLFFTSECSDGSDLQTRTGGVQLAALLKLPATFATSFTSLVSTIVASAGTFTATFSWTTTGNIATLNVTMLSSLVPTSMTINYFLLYASHTAFTYL